MYADTSAFCATFRPMDRWSCSGLLTRLRHRRETTSRRKGVLSVDANTSRGQRRLMDDSGVCIAKVKGRLQYRKRHLNVCPTK